MAGILKVPEEYSEIQMAIDTASPTDTILINTGTWLENLVIEDKPLVIASYFLLTGDESLIPQTIIDGNFSDHVLFMNLPEESDTLSIIGLDIRHGMALKGGGIHKSGAGTLKIDHCNIQENKCSGITLYLMGAGVYNEDGKLLISNSSVCYNMISEHQTGSHGRGGGVFCDGDFYLMNTRFEFNSIEITVESDNAYATGEGGGVMLNGNGMLNGLLINNNYVYVETDASLTICKPSGTFKSNCSDATSEVNSGGISAVGDNLVIMNSKITNNIATAVASGDFNNGTGFAISTSGGIFTNGKVINCLVCCNSVATITDGLGCVETVWGGGISGGEVINSTVVDNVINSSTGLAEGAGISNAQLVMNSIVAGNTGSPDQISTFVNVQYTNIEGGYAGTGNINADPDFIGSGPHPWTLSEASPCIDAGNPDTTDLSLPATDLLGNPRLTDGDDNGTLLIDMGAYEYITTQIIAGFGPDLHFGKAPLQVCFYDSSLAYMTQIDYWDWDFNNDGIVDSNIQNPEYIYTEPGVYTVELVVTDTSGTCSDKLMKVDLIRVSGVISGFYANTILGEVPLTVQFYDTSVAQYTEIGQWEWDFENDGTIDSWVQHPIWIYDLPGIYSVKLIVTDTSGLVNDTLLYQNYIEVLPATSINYCQFSSSIVKVFPNPFSDEIRILAQDEANIEIEITLLDLTGEDVFAMRKKCTHLQNSLHTLSTGHLLPGIYFCLIRIDNHVYLTKMIKP